VWQDWDKLSKKSDLSRAEANVDLGMCDLAALSSSSLANFGMAMAKVHDTDTGCHIKKLYAFVGCDVCALALLKDMLCEAPNSSCNVLFAECRRVEI
jgi:hypothetical protein